MPGRSARAQQHWRRAERDDPPCSARPGVHQRQSTELQSRTDRGRGIMEYGAVAVVSGVAWILYWNTLAADFAYDDSRAIKTNQDLLSSTPLTSLFRNDFWGTPLTHSGSHKSYRPLCVLSFRLNYLVAGLDPWGYHLVNVLLHAAVAALFTHFASIVFLHRPFPTYVAGILFAVHPIHTEAVAGVVGRADVGACFFFLMAMLSYMTYCKYRDKPEDKDLVDVGGGGWFGGWWSWMTGQGGGAANPEQPSPTNSNGKMVASNNTKRWLYLYASLAWAACSMLTKEHGITVLTVCALYDAFVQHRLAPKDLLALPMDKRYQGLREGLLHLLGAAVLLVGIRLHLMGSKPPDFAPADNPAADSDSALTRTLTFLFLPAYNFWLLLYPRWLSFDWSMESIPLITSLGDSRNLATLCFYSGLWYAASCLVKQLQARRDIGYNHSSYVTPSAFVYRQQHGGDLGNGSSLNTSGTSGTSGIASNSYQSASCTSCLGYGQQTSNGTMKCGGKKQISMTSSNSTYQSFNNNLGSSHGGHQHHVNGGVVAFASFNTEYRETSVNSTGSTPSATKSVSRALWSWALSPNASPWSPFSWTLSSRSSSTRSSHWARTSNPNSCCGSFSGHTNALFLSLALMVLPFVPATNLFFYVGFVVAERVLYIPSMGYCLLVALGAEQIYRKQKVCDNTRDSVDSGATYSRSALWKRRALTLAFIMAGLALSVRTIKRNEDWRSEETLYRSGIFINPPKAYGNLANILSARGRKTEAEWAYKKSLSYRSNMADVHYNLGILLQEQGRYEEALLSYKLAIQFRPRLAMAHLNLGLVLGILGRKEEAIEVYRHCSMLDSAGLKDPKMHESTKISALFNLGRLYADDGKHNEAIEVYREAVRKMPDHYQPQSLYNMMGEAYFKLGQFLDAEHWYKEALRVKPDHIPAHLTYAKLLSKWNRPAEAEQWFLKAKAIAPNDSSIYQHYGQFLSESSRHLEAAEVYVHAADLAPDEYEIVFNTANTLRQAGKNADAEKYYYMAVKLRPNEVTSHMNLGAMLHVNGKLLEAETSYLEALRLKPDDPITQNNLQKLRNLLVQRGLRTHANQSPTSTPARAQSER